MMDAHVDALLDQLVRAEPRQAWSDVLRRARRARRRYTAVVAIVAALVAAPATWAAVHAFEGTPAPQDVSTSFTRLNNMADHAIQQGISSHWPQADASEARGVIEVQTPDGPEDLWSAPTDQGGQCYFVDWANDPPEQDGSKYGFGGCPPLPPPASNIRWGDVWIVGHPDLITISGIVYVDASTVQINLHDGSTFTLPVVKHFFLGSVATGTRSVAEGTRADKVTAFDADGNVVASSTRP